MYWHHNGPSTELDLRRQLKFHEMEIRNRHKLKYCVITGILIALFLAIQLSIDRKLFVLADVLFALVAILLVGLITHIIVQFARVDKEVWAEWERDHKGFTIYPRDEEDPPSH